MGKYWRKNEGGLDKRRDDSSKKVAEMLIFRIKCVRHHKQ